VRVSDNSIRHVYGKIFYKKNSHDFSYFIQSVIHDVRLKGLVP